MLHQKKRAENKEISTATLSNYYKPIKKFCVQNDILLNWDKISSRIPRGRQWADDRKPLVKELLELMKYPDRRIKPIVLSMCSGGFREGSWDYLKWKDVDPIEEKGEIVAAQVTIYRGEPDEYETFISPEAYKELKERMDFRAQHKEKITPESWLMRDLWDATSKAKRGMAAAPHQLKAPGVKRLIERALWAQGIRKELEAGKKRHEFQAVHGFRKVFTSALLDYMSEFDVKTLRGDNRRTMESYDRRLLKKKLLSGYLKAVPELTFFCGSVESSSLDNEKIQELEKRIADIEIEKQKQSENYSGEKSKVNYLAALVLDLYQEVARLGGKLKPMPRSYEEINKVWAGKAGTASSKPIRKLMRKFKGQVKLVDVAES